MTLADLFGNIPGSLLLISEIVMFWCLANYAVTPDPVQQTKRSTTERQVVSKFWTLLVLLRSLAVGAALLIVAGTTKGSLILAIVLVVGSLLLPIARRWLVSPEYGAELEIGTTALLLVLIVVCVSHWRLVAVHGWAALPFPGTRASALCLIIAIVVFNVRGATYVVRGLLNKCGALPELVLPQQSSVTERPHRVVTETSVDAVEFNRGRWIGNLERMILLVIVAEASYPAIAFLMAAKTFIRSKDLENREWAEYFLLGTLASIAVSLVGGLLIRLVLEALW
jgi:amino acid transporter